ncbi:2958_t:CDS:2, partial [Ambispora leptoticha]
MKMNAKDLVTNMMVLPRYAKKLINEYWSEYWNEYWSKNWTMIYLWYQHAHQSEESIPGDMKLQSFSILVF